ncbi:hypothetical protein [Massilia sp. ST3]|uniref:hypothetical protein n=1 Tax=Massilia sp. ST3 TaxID=2824903 RepID=UPI001B83889E|nr:hypothetical protein [Massilia sp. ST3]MBQ5946407.1 hypothetical protein [Massilia sp. ST3]
MTKKVETSVTLARGGMHSPARYRAAKKMILECKYKKTRLYHFILKGSTDPKAYNKAADGIARLLRDNNIPCTGKGCWEVSEDKGLHFHFMVLVEAEYGKVDHWLNPAEDGPLKTMLRRFGVKVHIAEPQNDMHRVGGNKLGKMPLYAYVSKSGPKLEDALIRISYLFKKDQKDDSMKRIYYSTRDRAPKAEAQPAEQVSEAQAVEAPEPNTTTNEGNDMNVTNLIPSAFAYLGAHYETCVDRGYNPVEIQAYLGSKGIHKSVLAIKHDLEHTFQFAGYVEAHPAPPMVSYTEADAQLAKGRQSSRVAKLAVPTIDRFPTPH